MRRAWLAGLCSCFALGCAAADGFVCAQDRECGASGLCEPEGACSFPDERCTSGRRFGAAGPEDVAGACVGDDPPAHVEDDEPDAPWVDCEYSYRRRLTIPALDLPHALAHVPVLLRLGPDRIDYDTAASNGTDLLVVANGSEFALPRQIEAWKRDGDSQVWIGLPSLPASEDVHVYVYWGGPRLADSPAVWNDDYAAVWHLGSSRSASATAERADLSARNVTFRAGRIAGAARFAPTARADATGDRLLDLWTNGATISAWINAVGPGEQGEGHIFDRSQDGVISSQLRFAGDGSGRLEFVRGFTLRAARWRTRDPVVEFGGWHHLAIAYDDASSPTLFVDGEAVAVEVADVPAGVPLPDTGPLVVGNRAESHDRAFTGILDELRISTVARSPEWAWVEYLAADDLLFEVGDLEWANDRGC